MAPRYIIAVSELRFRVLERSTKPGQLTPALREIVSHDFVPAGVGRASGGALGGLRAMGGFPTLRFGDEQQNLQGEDLRRTIDWLVDQIEHFLLARPGHSWALAASPSLHDLIVARLRPSVRGSLTETLERNIATASTSDIAGHFRGRW